jgi:hypothetical protein
MGADFIGGYVHVAKTRQKAYDALEAIDASRIAMHLINAGLSVEETEYTVREQAFDYVNMVYDAYEGYRRDGDVWIIDDKTYVVTGGMSWGDSPTELWDAVVAVSALGITH